MEQRQMATRKDVLASFGAEGEVANEILDYNQNHFDQVAIELHRFPLPDEPFVTAWRQYARETHEARSIVPLAKYLVQLQFPIKAGTSEAADYLAATRRGLSAEGMQLAVGLGWHAPEQCRLTIHPTAAGHVPVLIAENRADFVALLQALTRQNEPYPIPASMGACMIAGYNNWHRVALLRDRFLASACGDDSWSEEFPRIKAQKDLYQDRFIILSAGPYSGVPASALGLDDQQWLDLSLVIRREHECTHYFTRRIFSSMRNNLLDELIADYMGITAAAGSFRADWLFRFFGLESFPNYREGGRLQNYRGTPPLSDRAFTVLKKLVVAAATNLETFDRHYIPEFQHSLLRPVLLKILTQLTTEEIASKEAPKLLRDSFAEGLKTLDYSGTVRDLWVSETVREKFDLRNPAITAMQVAVKASTSSDRCHLLDKRGTE